MYISFYKVIVLRHTLRIEFVEFYGYVYTYMNLWQQDICEFMQIMAFWKEVTFLQKDAS